MLYIPLCCVVVVVVLLSVLCGVVCYCGVIECVLLSVLLSVKCVVMVVLLSVLCAVFSGILALQPLVEDLFLVRSTTSTADQRELDTQREVLCSMLLRLAYYHQVL